MSVCLDDGRRLVRVVAGERANGRHLAQAFCQVLRTYPEAAAYDQVWNLLHFDGDATNEDVAQIQRAYLEAAVIGTPPAYTCFVTHDDCMTFWAAAMDVQFEPRRHLVMRSLDQAEGWLRQIRGWDRQNRLCA